MSGPLTDLQARLHGFVVNDGPAPVTLISDNPRTDAETLLGVYHNTYRESLIEALADDFQALRALLGEDGFREMALAYIKTTPSRHYSIRWYGAGLAGFLAEKAPWRERPELADLAAWEWALGEAADAADAAPIEAGAFAAITPEAWAGLTFEFHPALRRLDLRWSAPGWRLACEQAGDEPPDRSRLPAETADGEPVAWAVWREDVRILYRSLAEYEAPALDAARGGAAFGALCETLAASVGDAAAATAGGFLRSWVAQGWITAVEG